MAASNELRLFEDASDKQDVKNYLSLDNLVTRVKLGEVWKLGEHRLMCGDACKREDADKLMNGEKAKILFTSPPYADMRDYGNIGDLSISHLVSFIPVWQKHTDFEVINLGIKRKDFEIVRYWDDYLKEAKMCGYKLLAWNVWDKKDVGSISQQQAMFPIRHEWVFVFGNKPIKLNKTWKKKSNQRSSEFVKRREPDGSTKLSTRKSSNCKYKPMESVLSIQSEKGKIRSQHPACFPVGFPYEYIKAMTQENDIVIDCFGGSGTTLIACNECGRVCYIMELSPEYCEIIIRRWEILSGKEAELIT